jgi:group II intron reverse transcriptase/maturase
MIDYYEIKSQPITRVMVWQAYWKVRSGRGSGGIDNMRWEWLDKNRNAELYKLWNRLASGSYIPMPVKEVIIKKKQGGERKLGVPTLLDRIAQQVVKTHLEPLVEPQFHNSSFGYRPSKSCHQAIEQAERNTFNHDFVIDLDIKSFFDTIDHELLMKAVRFYCKDKWILLYVKRWLASGIVQKDGSYIDRLTGTPQGGVISPLLANIFMHVSFDKWMENNHPEKPFERYADDVVVHCKTEKQAIFVLNQIRQRLWNCKLNLHPEKTKIVNLRGKAVKKYPKSYDFLGFTIRPNWCKINGRKLLVPSIFISSKSESSVLEKFRELKIHKWRKPIEEVARELRPIIRGIINYYCKFSVGHTRYIWNQLNARLLKWVKWEKGLYKMASVRWLKKKFEEFPTLFPHWKLVHP